MTFHFIIIPCVQFHFRASTIYNVCTQGITLTKRQSARLIRIRHKNSLLLICTEPIVHYAAIT